ncbi:MAG: hypothetical protein ACLU9L_10835 [Christensenellales bacterium]
MASKGIEEFVRRLRKQGYRMEVTPETDTHSSTYIKNKTTRSNSKGSDSFLGYTAERTWDNFKDVFKNIHKNAQINASAGYGEDVLKQLDKLKESSAGKGWNKKGIEQLEQAFRPSIEQTRKEKDERGIEEIKRVQQNQNELDANIEQKYSGLTENQKKWGNRIGSIGSVLPSALAYAVPGGQAVSAGVTFGNISGDAIGNALLEGKTPREAQSYGYLEGLKEAAVEQAFGGVAGLSKKAGLSKGLNALLDNKVSNKAARTLLSRTGAATGEGLEEVVSTLAEPLVRKAAFNDEELQNVSLEDLGESFLGGATAAAILGTGQDAINAVRNKRSITKIANQTGRTKEEVKNSLNNFNTVEARDVVKALDPADFEPKLSTIENMQRYAKEIDDVFTGKAKDGSFIELGETPAILQRLGAKPRKLTMTQDTVRKIAYPEGYKIGGKSMGGKHNLGIPALKQLPAQLENPMAVLKSKTQPNSFVVLTNWKLDDGRTVVTPIHLDKQGRITIDNRVVSTYGKDVNKLLGENDENVLWRKNDRSIDQLLGERLQLPMASSDDASSVYNMPQGENYVNREIADNTEIDYNKLKGGRNDEASIDLRTREIYGRGMDGGLDSAAYASEGTQGRRGDSQESIYGAAKPGNAELYGHLRMEQDGGRIHGLGSITTEDPVVHQALIQNNAAAFPMRSDVSGVAFFDAINKVKSENKHGAYVTAYEPADYDGFRTLFLDESGLSGVGVKQDGDIVSVFNSPNSPHTHAVTNLLLNALDAGGNKLDNFDGKLSDFYAKHGFIPVARVAFDRNYAPENWNYELFGEPDVIFWIHNGDSPQAVAQKIGDYPRYDTSKLPLFNSYEEAAAYRDSLLNGSGGLNGKGTPNSSTMSENQQTNPTGENMGERRTTKRILNDESNLVFDDPQMQSEFYDEINNAKNVYYEKVSTKDATEKALSEIEQRGIEGAANLFYKNLGTSKRGKERAENLILGVELAKAYTNAGDVDGASNIISEIMPITTDAAQVMSLTKALYKLGGRGVLKSIQSDLARINKQRGTEIEIDETLANRLAGAKTEPEIQAAAQAIEADLKQRIPVKLHEKLGALRRISMLANPKTQVRNLVGNAAMNLMGRMSSAIDGMLQRMLIRDPNLRTNTIFKRRSPEYSNARTFAKEYFKANKEAVSGDSRYDSRTARLLRDRDTFKNKAMRFVEQKTNRVMEWGDEIFTGNAFQRHFANEVVARKLSMEDLKNPANRQQLEQVINHAALKAQKETFRDESRLANSITSLKNRLNNSKNPLAKTAGAWIDGVIPFTKTPINVTKRAIDYSPLGIIKTVYQGIESRGTPMAKANFINSLSQNLTGTVMAGLGYTLAQSGLIRVGGDDKEEYYESDQGRQRYSLEIGDTSISLDWLSPAAMPFFMGAVWSETDGADSIDDVFAAGQQIFGPLMEMSMMSSADDMITNIRKADTNIEAIAEALIYTPFESYLLQYLPTTGSQLNQVIDPTRRTTYTNADSEVLGRLEKTGRKALNKLPGANLLLENMGLENVANAPYVNAWGEKQVNDGNVLERVFNSFINPAYVNEIKSDEVDREIERLYNSNVEDSKYIIPTTSFGTVTNGGNEYKMTTTEVTNHRQIQGQMSKQILRSLINNSAYRSASDEDKIKMIKDVYKYAEYRADTKMLEGRGETYNIKESDWRKKVDYLDAAGIPPTTYFLAHNARSNATGEYTLNQWGERESIKGSAKKAQVNAINGYGMTAAQKLLFLYLETPSYSYGKEYSGMSNDQARKVVANYVAGLNIPYEEKVKILKRAGYHIKNGYAYWD